MSNEPPTPTYEPETITIRTYSEVPVRPRLRVVMQLSALLEAKARRDPQWTTADAVFALNTLIEELTT